MNYVQPNKEWYKSKRQKNNDKYCPFTDDYECPLYYASRSVLNDIRSFLTDEDDKNADEFWKNRKEWKEINFNGPTLNGNKKRFSFFNICPEVSYDVIGLFVSDASAYTPEPSGRQLDKETWNTKCDKENLPLTHWLREWAEVTPQHYSECELYDTLIENNEKESPENENVFHKVGDIWKIVFQGEEVGPLKDMKGFHYLKYLLQHPQKDIKVYDLYRYKNGVNIVPDTAYKDMTSEQLNGENLSFSDLSKTLQMIPDGKARTKYRAMIKTLEQSEDDARDNRELDILSDIKEDKGKINKELNDIMHKQYDSKARPPVTNAIKRAINKIGKNNKNLEQYLLNHIKTGVFCSYSPDPNNPIHWAS